MTGLTIVLVEGYDDRAFWSGYLRHVRGCLPSVAVPAARLAGLPPGTHQLLRQTKGTYTYLSPSDGVVQVIPFQEQHQAGQEPLRALLHARLNGRKTRPEALRGLVVCTDDDRPAGSPPRHDRAWLVQLLRNAKVTDIPALAGADTDGVHLPDGVVVTAVHWRVDLGPDPALPDQQSLERVACAALHVVAPARVASVRTWLAGLPDLSAGYKDHKATAGALWAGWSAHDGWARFYEALWEDEPTRAALLEALPALESAALIELLR
ncbi:MAG: hypothetical protein JNM72_23820 [Deltaproteobacteria bacterium]|nr:hypothetical protein [Deltaproteobacteria bacterium]